MKKLLGLSCLLSSLSLMAGTMGETATFSPVYLGVYGGYGNIDGAINQDGNFTQFRSALGARLPWKPLNLQLGGELGVQWGNIMRLSATEDIIDINGGLPIQATLKPIADALVTLKYQLSPESPVSVLLKGGIAYRQLQLNAQTSPTDALSKVNGELQAGLTYQLSEHAQFIAVYQGIYSSSNAGVQYTSLGFDGYFDYGYLTISQIPTQQSGFLGIEYTF